MVLLVLEQRKQNINNWLGHVELVHEDAPLWGSKMGHLWYKSYVPAFASSLRGAPFNMAGPISSVSTVKQ
jgi:hypothetical protein